MLEKAQFKLNSKENFAFNSDVYHFSYQIEKLSIEKEVQRLNSFVIYPLENGLNLRISGRSYLLNLGDYLFCSNVKELQVTNPKKSLLCGGTRKVGPHEVIEKVNTNQAKVVIKPWGREYWLNWNKGGFVFKKLVFGSQKKTSLQYHEKKKETHFIYKGKGEIFCERLSEDNNEKRKMILNPYTMIHIPPMFLHRTYSLDNLTLFEVSSPEIDDVIRVKDENNRKNGRIASEHI